ncbi:MAG: hypothetical protein AUK36_04865 [Zetaproteobacteria bacterium CG2_30_59_37]|nr:MAG: hypothetical protein AUK36_04865 [Zetaproteobacteria bacterium CG2_30_59_37]
MHGGELMAQRYPTIFGEVLFDCFPGGEQVLGGAPFNVAWHLQAFGESPLFISRVGNDTQGNEILDAMLKWGMRTDGVQIDAQLPTGRVDVSFSDGEPAYDIVHPSAWDAIAPCETSGDCRLIYHGSLALRDAGSRAALAQFKAQGDPAVFLDVNLRSPWWRRDGVAGLLEGADWVKLNTDELALLSPSGDARDVMAEHGLQGLILTHGADGAEILTVAGETLRIRPAVTTQVVDTVGAGDAFASVMLLGMLRGWPMATTAGRAQDFASRMVARRGATVSDPGFYDEVMSDWLADDMTRDQPQESTHV